MRIELTEEQEMVRAATRQFAGRDLPPARVRALHDDPLGYDVDWWRRAAGLGWTAMMVPEQHGGAGLGSAGLIEAAVIAEELGRALQPGPFLAVNVVADALATSGSAAQCEAVLPGLAAGEAVATLAIAEGDGSWDGRQIRTTLEAEGGHLVLRGAKRAVLDAGAADHLLVTASDGPGLTHVLVPTASPGITVVPLATLDLGRRLADVRFADVEVGPDAVVGERGGAHAAIERQLQVAVALSCAETVGLTAQVLESTVDYARDRMAFGRPIGSFQSIKHLLADAATYLEGAQAATWHAVDAFAAGDVDAAEALSVAKAFVGEHCAPIVEACMQTWGGIAMTWEHDSHLYLRRVQTNEVLFGSSSWHRDRLCALIGMGAR